MPLSTHLPQRVLSWESKFGNVSSKRGGDVCIDCSTHLWEIRCTSCAYAGPDKRQSPPMTFPSDDWQKAASRRNPAAIGGDMPEPGKRIEP